MHNNYEHYISWLHYDLYIVSIIIYNLERISYSIEKSANSDHFLGIDVNPDQNEYDLFRDNTKHGYEKSHR